ncbi:alpha/beta hydrolase [Streptomyces sp. MTZ3.1]|uniref:Alpha/beta hydrolase n=1 Tax=Streptomyces meridianus TaxID=2938945 RepID=A0ABT0X5Q4_9ACTN|nr:alpha/beta hydrolase [Streptomyces meridianus]MCM2577754.1 alpha/beta hydrolase [Streptomyces meridianus]
MLELAPRPPQRSAGYGPHPSQVIDWFLPDGDPRARVTVLHGGFWREAYDRAHLSPFAAALAERGVAVALAEYRRVGGGGGWPETFEDVRAVLSSAWPDRGPAVLFGHSAGGHLALWAAAGGRVPAPGPGRDTPQADQLPGPGSAGGAGPARVVALAPVADLAGAHRLGLSGGAVAGLLGGADRVEGLLPWTDPARLPPPDVPTVILHGAADADVPVGISRRYAAAVRERGGTVELRELPGRGHYAPLIPGTEEFELLHGLLAGGGSRP